MTVPIQSTSRAAEIARKHREYLWPAVAHVLRTAPGRRPRTYAAPVGYRRPQVSRLLRRHSHHLRRPRQSQGHRPRQRTDRPRAARLDASHHRSHRQSRRKSRADYPRRAAKEFLHQFRHRSQRNRPPAGPRRHRFVRRDRAAPLLLRHLGRRQIPHRAEAMETVRRHRPGRLPRPQRLLLPLPAGHDLSRVAKSPAPTMSKI